MRYAYGHTYWILSPYIRNMQMSIALSIKKYWSAIFYKNPTASGMPMHFSLPLPYLKKHSQLVHFHCGKLLIGIQL